jgi:hypothetical protein
MNCSHGAVSPTGNAAPFAVFPHISIPAAGKNYFKVSLAYLTVCAYDID